MSCLVVIPARGGSRGVPRKNVIDVAGSPLVAHAIRAARAAQRVTRVVVSTDDAEIAAVAQQHGAESITRPAALSGDTASSESALLHVLQALREREGYAPELVMLMQCTSPLTIADDLDGLVDALVLQNADAAFLAVPFYHFVWTLDAEHEAQPVNHEGRKRKRRQDLPPQYLESGAAYVMRTATFIETGERFCGRVTMHIVDETRCLEIDEPIDVLKADTVLRAQARRSPGEQLPQRIAALVMDFDGVLTDDAVTVDQTGKESVRCSRSDGLGLGLLRERGVRLLILSKERNPVVSARAEKLKIECLQGIDDKLTALRAWAEQNTVSLAEIVYAGNDVNDLACMRAVGCAAAPADARAEALSAARIVLTRNGGNGAVRELCDLISATLAR